MLNDLRTGPDRHAAGGQILAKCFGVLVGSLVGSMVYLLRPRPADDAEDTEGAAPAVAPGRRWQKY